MLEEEDISYFTDITHHEEFFKSDYFVFGLYQIRPDGTCGCEYEDCKNIGKHPIRSGWQHPIKWDQEQWYNGHMAGQFKTGYGILMKGLLVVDVDQKNGGVPSLQKLMTELPELAECGFIVNTGSGKGSCHLYFKYDGKIALRTGHPDYPGIDFKSTGFVVGPGSTHKSGNKYEVSSGAVAEMTKVPESLVTLLEKTGTFCINDDNKQIEMTEEDLQRMCDHVPDDLQYEDWISVGMAINDLLEGDGFELWDSISKRSSRPEAPYDQHMTHFKWKSFNPGGGVGFATLKYWALKGGWTESITFTATREELTTVTLEEDNENIDLSRPPGFVGDVCDWINDQCGKPRKNLATMGALNAIGNIAGLRYEDDLPRGSTSNLFSISVAESGTGKGAVFKAINEIHQIAGLLNVTYGSSKSSAEIYRNLMDKNVSLYNVDEIGHKLSSIANASKSGATHNETWFGDMMAIYSAADSIFPLNGDQAREMSKDIRREVQDLQKKVDENEIDRAKGMKRIEILKERLKTPALIRPFVSLSGFSTDATLVPIITPERVNDGFLSRTLIAWESEALPTAKADFSPRRMSDSMRMSLKGLSSSNDSDLDTWEEGERTKIKTTQEAKVYLNTLQNYFHDLAVKYREENGMHATANRGVELVSKVSYILAIPGRQRTLEHVKWAFAYVLRDIEKKIEIALGNDAENEDAIFYKIMSVLDSEELTSLGIIRNKCRKKGRTNSEIDGAVKAMVQSGHIILEKTNHSKNGKEIVKYRLNDDK